MKFLEETMVRQDFIKFRDEVEAYYHRNLDRNELIALNNELKDINYQEYAESIKKAMLRKIEYFTVAQVSKIVEEYKKTKQYLKNAGMNSFDEIYENQEVIMDIDEKNDEYLTVIEKLELLIDGIEYDTELKEDLQQILYATMDKQEEMQKLVDDKETKEYEAEMRERQLEYRRMQGFQEEKWNIKSQKQ